MFREKHAWVAVCKHCGIDGPIDDSENKAYSKAQQAGWQMIGEDCYCPEHVNLARFGPKELREFAQRLRQFIEVQERK